jgi:hypothetical protein
VEAPAGDGGCDFLLPQCCLFVLFMDDLRF